MIFDERDLENFEDDENEIKPLNNQMSLEDFVKNSRKVKSGTDNPPKEKKNRNENDFSALKDAKSSSNKVSEEKKKPTKKMQTKENKALKNDEFIPDILQNEEIEDAQESISKSKKGRKTKILKNEEELMDIEENNGSDIDDENSDFQPEENVYDNEGNILKSIKSVMHESMMPYSEYVILDRALPRVEDGLKPVQRRILYSMYSLGLTPDKPFKKSARVVGDCLAIYHPHGDTSVYNAMVRMAQNFNMREILVEGHGNFGSVDGDPAAAMRYTEARLSELSLEMLKDIEKDTISWSYTYDDSHLEPDMLPSRFPNVLVNGTSGIAVGIATNFAPHNLGEAIDACVSYIDNPKISTEELMQVLKGPDFPTGGVILGQDGIKQAYETGKGKILIRSKVEIEYAKNDKVNLVITEFPYQVNKANCLQKISELKENNKDVLSSISEIRDESDRKGTRAVIVLKKDSQPEKVLNYLYKYSDLQVSFGINMVAIADGKPKLLSLKEILSYYTNYQREVVLKRTEFDLNLAKEREHILEGLIIAIENIDQIVKIIKKSASVIVAKQTLKQKYLLDEKQAQAIMDMRLSRLTNLEVEKLKNEINELLKLIKKLEKIISSKKMQFDIVKTEMLEIKKKFNNSRKTKITKKVEEISDEDLIKAIKPTYVLITQKNAIKQIPEKNYNKNLKIITEDSTLNEIHSNILLTDSSQNLLIFTNYGNVYKLSVDKIIEARFKDRGMYLKDIILNYHPDEVAINIFEEKNITNNKYILFTKKGLVKICAGSEFSFNKNSISSIKLKDCDELIAIQPFNEKSNMILVTKNGMALHAKTGEIPTQLRTGAGVKAINLGENDNVIFAGLINDEKILAITSNGYGKKVDLTNFDLLDRGRKGVKIYSLDKSAEITFAGIMASDIEMFALDDKNKAHLIDSASLPLTNRTNKGGFVIKDRKTIKLQKIYQLLNI